MNDGYIQELMEKDKQQEPTDHDISLVHQDVCENDESAGTGLEQDRIKN
jgi:hypothetical protein